MSTEWAPIPSAPGYHANTLGLIRGPSGRVLSPSRNQNGYRRVQISQSGRATTALVHRLIAEAFIGQVVGMEVDHIDNDPANNAVDNLQIVTRQQHAAISVARRPNCRRGHPMEQGKGRRYCPTCCRAREARRIR